MTCRTCGSAGSTLMTCLARYFGVSSTKWTEELHAKLYAYLSTQVDIRSERGMEASAVSAIGFGDEPETTARYMTRMVVQYLGASDPFWTCVGVTRQDGIAQLAAESGPLYGEMTAAARNVFVTEQRSPTRKTGEGIPGWLVAVGVVAVGGGVVYAATR